LFDCLDIPSVWSFARPGSAGITDVPVRSRLSVNTAEAAINAAIAGIGVAQVASYQAEPAVKRGALQVVLREFEAGPLPVSLLHAGREPLPLRTRAFLDIATARLKRELS